ncbi:MAG: hypothetical protein AAFN43_07915 [Pseudomonadota bacterium]
MREILKGSLYAYPLPALLFAAVFGIAEGVKEIFYDLLIILLLSGFVLGIICLEHGDALRSKGVPHNLIYAIPFAYGFMLFSILLLILWD